MAYKYGRRPPKNAPALRFASILRSDLPSYPASEDYLANLSGWQLLGNDKVGDCNAVTWANMRRLVTATLSTENYPTQDQVWQFYQTQNPGFDPNGSPSTDGPGSPMDQGMDIQTGLEYLHANGGPDGVKVVAFAKVDHTSTEEVEAALAIFGGLWTGITVLDANQQEFSEGKAWTDVSGSAIDGGHAVLSGGYKDGIKFITWAQETRFAPSFWNGVVQGTPLVEETWVVIWPEHLGTKGFEEGIDQSHLASDYQALTGSSLALS
jgi:hypothetical protein